MKNINDKKHIATFSDYVAQQNDDVLLKRRVLAVFLAAAFICAAATLALSYNG